MELLLYVIPFLLISSLNGQDSGSALILQPSGTIKRKVGENLPVRCSLNESIPTPENAEYEWFDVNDAKITDRSAVLGEADNKGSTLLLSSITDDDTGTYTCRYGGFEAFFKLEVQRTIQITNCPPVQKGQLGKETTIKCQASVSEARTWWGKTSGEAIDLDKDPNYRTDPDGLTIFELTDREGGSYQYNAIMGTDYEYEPVTLIVVVAPKITRPIGGTIGYVGEEHSLSCSASGKPAPTINWYKEGSTNPLVTGDRITISPNPDVPKTDENEDVQEIQSQLTFKTVEKEDEAIYTCKATGDKLTGSDQALEATDSAKMNVYIRPSIDDILPAEGNEDGQAALRCVARGFPLVDAIWINAETNVQYSTSQLNNGPSVSIVEEVDAENNNIKMRVVTLTFTKLKSTDAGTYRCVARNSGGEASKEAVLSVTFKPKFDDDESGPYYTWTSNQDNFVPCTAMGNPEPTFKWYKKGVDGNPPTLITNQNQNYLITHDNNPDNPLKPTSKLLVRYTGSNANVFGEYICEATNKVGDDRKTYLVQEGQKPGQAIVTVPTISATRIVFLVTEPTVLGPPVTQYRLKFTYPNGTIYDRNYAKEYRDFTDDKSSEPRTRIEIFDLKPTTSYSFSVQALNPVGDGPERVLDLTTIAIESPGIVKILNSPFNPEPTTINVRWEEPDDGGDRILEYMLTHQEVNARPNNASIDSTDGYKLLSPKYAKKDIPGITTRNYRLENLKPGMFYMITVKAFNQAGYGTPGQIIIKMKDAEVVGESTGQVSPTMYQKQVGSEGNKQTAHLVGLAQYYSPGGLSTGAIIGILIAVFFILFIVVDVFCYFKSNCGVLMTIREAIGGGRGDEGYSAAKTDDVENLAKKDELTEEAKAAEENEIADGQVNDEKKEPLLSSEEQKVDTVDEVDKSPEKVLEPDEKEEIKPDTDTKTDEAPPSTEEKSDSAPEKTDEKPSEPNQE